MREFFRELRFYAGEGFRLRIEGFKLRLAIRLSDIKQKAMNRRFHVVLVTVGVDKKGREINRLRSICNRDFKKLKRMGWLPKKMSYLELREKSFYSTAIGLNNRQTQEERSKAMKRYMRYVRRRRK